MSGTEAGADTDAPTTPEETTTFDTRTQSITWTVPTDGIGERCRRTALFGKRPGGWVLVHVRTVHTRVRGPPSDCKIDDTVTAEDLPGHVTARVDGEIRRGGDGV